MSIEEGRKRQQAKQAQSEKQQMSPLDLEALHKAIKEVIQEEMGTLHKAVRQVVGEFLANQTPITQQQDLSLELGAIDAQIEAMRLELQFVRTALDLLVKAGLAHALASTTPIMHTVPQNLANAATIQRPVQPDDQQEKERQAHQPQEDSVIAHEGTNTEDRYEAALPLPKDIRLPGRGDGPAPLVLETQRQRVKR